MRIMILDKMGILRHITGNDIMIADVAGISALLNILFSISKLKI